MDFSAALDHLKAGKTLTRDGWNGADQWIYLVSSSDFKVNRKPLIDLFDEGTEIHYRAHIDIKTIDDSCVPWVASQSDLLSDDWEIVDRG